MEGIHYHRFNFVASARAGMAESNGTIGEWWPRLGDVHQEVGSGTDHLHYSKIARLGMNSLEFAVLTTYLKKHQCTVCSRLVFAFCSKLVVAS
jgi:hypothetical protein